MASHEKLRELGLFDARAPRYTSYPPANHFNAETDASIAERWLKAVPEGEKISLYLHIPYCRRLCWFCACRTQGTSTNRPLVPYLSLLKKELALVAAALPQDVSVNQIHLGGGTPTLLPSHLIRDLGKALKSFRPWDPDIQFSVEIDPTEVDQSRIDALAEIGMTRASIGVQDFDPIVQETIGRIQGYEDTRNVVEMLRRAGITSLNMDILYGLPHQTKARMSESVQRVLSLNPDRVALYGYAHVPWMAKRQVMIPAEHLPGAEERLELFDIARELFLWDGYQEIGIDHYARAEDSLSKAANSGNLRRNFQGYTDDASNVLIGLGASAISRYPQGFAQNISSSSQYAAAIEGGSLATARGHIMTSEDKLRARMIESLMCDFALDLDALSEEFSISVAKLRQKTMPIVDRLQDYVNFNGNQLRLSEDARLIARLAAQELDAYMMPEGRHSRAL